VQNYMTMADRFFANNLIVLHQSMQQYCQPYRLWVLTLCDRMKAALDILQLENVESIHIDELLDVYPNLRDAQSNRKWEYFIWTCKPHGMHRILSEYKIPSLCYLDGDSMWFHEPSQLFTEIEERQLALTPHRFSPRVAHYIVNGVFNAGFIFVKQEPPVTRIIEEWMQVCIDWKLGRLTEQVHLNCWPEKYGAYTIQHKGINLAPWNQAAQYLYHTKNGVHYVDADPITWYHFHGGLTQASYLFDPFIKRTLYPIYQKAQQQAQKITRGLYDV